ncbi:MAG: hypothetical protein NVSMB56_02080 [Pyrinomonadaceae bacterium]
MSEENKNPHLNALPNYQNAEIPRKKLEGYTLDPMHKVGRHKARVFRSALGFEKADWEELAKRIHVALPYHEAIATEEGEYGRKFQVILPIEGLNERIVEVLTVWIIRHETDFPSLVMMLVTGEKK